MKTATLQFTRQFVVLAAALSAALLFVMVAQAWTGPTAAPPGGNVPAPVNVGATAQVKNGGLGLTTLIADTICFGADCRTSWPADSGGSGGSGGSGSDIVDSLRIGPAGCNNIITTATSCKTMGYETCTGSGCTSQYYDCEGGYGGSRIRTCPTQPLQP